MPTKTGQRRGRPPEKKSELSKEGGQVPPSSFLGSVGNASNITLVNRMLRQVMGMLQTRDGKGAVKASLNDFVKLIELRHELQKAKGSSRKGPDVTWLAALGETQDD